MVLMEMAMDGTVAVSGGVPLRIVESTYVVLIA